MPSIVQSNSEKKYKKWEVPARANWSTDSAVSVASEGPSLKAHKMSDILTQNHRISPTHDSWTMTHGP